MFKKIHPAWLVLVCMILVQGGIIGVVVNCTGVLFAAIIKDLGFRAGDLSIYYTIRQLICAASIGLTAKLYFKRNSRIVMFLMGCCCAAAFYMMSVSTQVWHWYIAALFLGVGMSCTAMIVPIVLSNWFHSHKGLVVGLSMSASGVGGALYSPISSQLIQNFGWRTTAVITGTIGFIMVTLGSLGFYITPEKLGLKPYGEKAEAKAPEQAGKEAQDYQVPGWVFIAALFALLTVNSYTQLNNQIPTFARSIGYSLSVGAIFTSCSMIGNIFGKLLSGALTDRIGVYRAIQFNLIMTFLSMVLYLFGSNSQLIMQLASLLYGLIYSLGTTIPALLFLDLYGKEKYGSKVQVNQTISYFIMALTSFLFPYIYDLTGTFSPVFAAGAVICVVSFLLIEKLRRYSQSRI